MHEAREGPGGSISQAPQVPLQHSGLQSGVLPNGDRVVRYPFGTSAQLSNDPTRTQITMQDTGTRRPSVAGLAQRRADSNVRASKPAGLNERASRPGIPPTAPSIPPVVLEEPVPVPHREHGLFFHRMAETPPPLSQHRTCSNSSLKLCTDSSTVAAYGNRPGEDEAFPRSPTPSPI